MSLTNVKNMGEQGIDVEKIRGDFPILSREIHGKPLVYLDSAASCLLYTSPSPRDVEESRMPSSA